MNAAVCPIFQPEVLSFEPRADGAADEHPPVLQEVPLAERADHKAPSCRDFEVYQQVAFEGMTQRKVAALHKISQPRVNQILHDMAAWVADHTPGFAAELTPPQQLRLARYTFQMQLQNLRERVISAFEESRGNQTVSRTTVIGGMRQTVEYTRPCQGNPRYLREAAKLGETIFKLEGGTMGMAVPAPSAGAGDWRFSDEASDETDEVPSAEKERDEPGPTNPEEPSEAQEALSSWEARRHAPDLTREEMQAVTAKQEAVCEALQARLEQLEAQERELNNTLSLGTGPLVPEGKSRPSRNHQHDKTADRRHDFLGDDPPALSIQERIDMKK